jgi:hypothetical protein
MRRPALTWLALWLGIASAVAVGIVAGFLILRLLAPDVAIAASRPVAQPTAPVDVSRSASAARLPGASQSTAEAPHGQASPSPSPVATATPGRGLTPVRTPIPSARDTVTIVLAARSGTRVAGTASWWASFGPGIYAALPGYVAGTHVTIRIWSGELYVDAPVITSCQCFVGTPDERIVDVSPGILRALGLDPGRGLYPVAIEYLP